MTAATSEPLRHRLEKLTPAQREALFLKLQKRRRQRLPDSEEAPPEAAGPDPAERHLPFPMTEIQQTFWVGRHDAFELSGLGASVYLEFKIHGLLDGFPEGFRRAFQEMTERHDMLRAVVLPDGRQRILREVTVPALPVVDLRRLPEAAMEGVMEAARERLRYDEASPADWPLFDFFAYRLSSRELRLHGRMDAVMISGLSRNMLLEDLFVTLAGRGDTLPPLATSYRRYTLAREALRRGEGFRRARDYWLRRLSELPAAPKLPAPRSSGKAPSNRLTVRYLDLLDREDWERIKRRAGAEALTPSLVALTVYTEAVGRMSASSHFLLGMEGTEYLPAQEGLERVVGNYNTTRVLEVKILPGSFLERARRLQSRMLEDLEHREFSGIQVLRELARFRRAYGRALVPIFFNSVIEYAELALRPPSGDPAAGGPPPPVTLEEVEATLYLPQVALLPSFAELPDGSLGCKCQALEDHFRDGVVVHLMEAVGRLLEELADHPRSWSAPRPVPPPPRPGPEPPPQERAVEEPLPRPGDPEIPAGLVALWREALAGSSGASPEDALEGNFFDQGGDSFRLLVLEHRLRQTFGHGPSLKAFLERPTLAHLAALMAAAGPISGGGIEI